MVYPQKSGLWDFGFPIIGTTKGDSPKQAGCPGRKGIPMEVEIRHVRGHVEVYSQEGAFLFSADTVYEARMELLEEAA